MNQIKSFVDRHIGIGADDQKDMLDFLGYKDMYTFIKDVVPESILEDDYLDLGEGLSEMAALKKLDKIAKQNKIYFQILLQIGINFLIVFIQKNLLRSSYLFI